MVATIELPAGVSASPGSVTVLTSLGQAIPDSTGSVTLSVYAGITGSQLAVVVSPAGNPMLMGWLDATHNTISAATTAQVLAYFSLGGATLLSTADAQTMIADIPAAPGLAALQSVIESQLAANVDAFASANTSLTQAVSTFATAIFASANQNSAGSVARHVRASVIQPTAQSGISVLEGNPFSAYITNDYRRRSHAFVNRLSYTVAGNNAQIADPDPVTDFQVPPVIGLTGGVTGALTDMMAAYYGLQPSAWTTITAPDSGSFAVPLVSNSATTTYQVTVVGPGANLGTSASLTSDQSQALFNVSVEGFVTDFFVPTVANIVVGSGQRDFNEEQDADSGKLFAAVAATLVTDITPIVQQSLTLKAEIQAGQWTTAVRDLTAAVGGLNSLQTLIIEAIKAQYPAKINPSGGTIFIPWAKVFEAVNKYMGAAGGVLQAFDSAKYAFDILNSDQADQWTILETNSQVKLNPPTSTADVGAVILLTATVLGVEDQTGYSYAWTVTSTATGGKLNEYGGGSRTNQTQYCSSSAQANWVYQTGDTLGDIDTVTVQVYSASNCANGKGDLLGTGTAAVTIKTTATLSPASPMVDVSDTQDFTVSTLATIPAGASYQWTLTGAGNIGAGNTVTTTTPQITYTAPDVAGSATLAVSILNSAGTVIGTGSTTITVGAADLQPWLGAWDCPDQIATFYAAPYTGYSGLAGLDPPPDGTNLLVTFADKNDLGVGYAWLIATSTTAVDNPSNGFTQEIDLSGGSIAVIGFFGPGSAVTCTK
jgi:hypothetical protein